MQSMYSLKLSRKIAGLVKGMVALAIVTGFVTGFALAAQGEPAVEVGITKPADLKPRELRFKMQGMILKVSVHEGDRVQAGQVLLSLDDAEEQVELKILKLDATDIRIKGAKVTSVAKHAELKRIKKLNVEGQGNDAELEKAQAEADIADLQIIQEQQDLLTKQAKIEKQQFIISKMQLLSPMDGVVQTVEARVGEMVDPSKPPVLTIVQNNPLIVDLNLPTAMSQLLKIGQVMRVSYDQKEWKAAKVSYLAPMADSASFTQAVHLALENPEGRSSGLKVFVELPAEIVAAQQSAEAEKDRRATVK